MCDSLVSHRSRSLRLMLARSMLLPPLCLSEATILMVVTRTFSDGRTDRRSDDGRGGVRDLDAL
jgi:hypothetical protein